MAAHLCGDIIPVSVMLAHLGGDIPVSVKSFGAKVGGEGGGVSDTVQPPLGCIQSTGKSMVWSALGVNVRVQHFNIATRDLR